MTGELLTFLNFPYEFLHFCCVSEICISTKPIIVELRNQWMFMFIFSFQLFIFLKMTSWLIAGGIVEVRIFLILHISSIPNISFLLILSILNEQLNIPHFINFERTIENCLFYQFWALGLAYFPNNNFIISQIYLFKRKLEQINVKAFHHFTFSHFFTGHFENFKIFSVLRVECFLQKNA